MAAHTRVMGRELQQAGAQLLELKADIMVRKYALQAQDVCSERGVAAGYGAVRCAVQLSSVKKLDQNDGKGKVFSLGVASQEFT